MAGRTDEVLGVSDVDRMRGVWGVTEDDEMFAEEFAAGEGCVEAGGKRVSHSGNLG